MCIYIIDILGSGKKHIQPLYLPYFSLMNSSFFVPLSSFDSHLAGSSNSGQKKHAKQVCFLANPSFNDYKYFLEYGSTSTLQLTLKVAIAPRGCIHDLHGIFWGQWHPASGCESFFVRQPKHQVTMQCCGSFTWFHPMKSPTIAPTSWVTRNLKRT